jgi:hypothetical protein
MAEGKPRAFRLPGEILELIDRLRRPGEGRAGVIVRGVEALAAGWEGETTSSWRDGVERRLEALEAVARIATAATHPVADPATPATRPVAETATAATRPVAKPATPATGGRRIRREIDDSTRRTIRDLHASGQKQVAIARALDLPRSTVQQIIAKAEGSSE